MSDPAHERRPRRRHRRRSHKRVGTVLALTGAMALVMGVFLVGWSFAEPNAQMRLFGLLYLAVAGGAIGGYLALAGLSELRRRRSDAVAAEEAPEEHAGFALLVALLLLALLSGLALQALFGARVALRAEHGRVCMTTLRMAATDAAWSALGRLGGAGQDGSRQVEDRVWPTGLTTKVTTRPLQATALPEGIAKRSEPGSYFVVTAAAAVENRGVDVCSYVFQPAKGSVSVLAWVERP
jgi:hypothetical protein